MTCTNCEKIRRFFRNGVQKLAPFSEYVDGNGNRYVVANRPMKLVNSSIVGVYGASVSLARDGTYMRLEFESGMGMGFPVTLVRKLFSNPYG